jgi:hypothetical protein
VFGDKSVNITKYLKFDKNGQFVRYSNGNVQHIQFEVVYSEKLKKHLDHAEKIVFEYDGAKIELNFKYSEYFESVRNIYGLSINVFSELSGCAVQLYKSKFAKLYNSYEANQFAKMQDSVDTINDYFKDFKNSPFLKPLPSNNENNF